MTTQSVIETIARLVDLYRNDYRLEPSHLVMGPEELDALRIVAHRALIETMTPQTIPMFYRGLRIIPMTEPGLFVGNLTQNLNKTYGNPTNTPHDTKP